MENENNREIIEEENLLYNNYTDNSYDTYEEPKKEKKTFSYKLESNDDIKGKILIAVIICLTITIILLIILGLNKEKTKTTKTIGDYNIVSRIDFDEYLYKAKYNDNTFFLEKGNKIYLIDTNNNVSFNFSNKYNIISSITNGKEGLILLSDNENYYLYDEKGNLLKESKLLINLHKDTITGSLYYSINEYLYNKDGRKLFECNYVLEITNNYVFDTSAIYNIETKEHIYAKDYLRTWENYYILINDKKVYVYDKKMKQLDEYQLVNDNSINNIVVKDDKDVTYLIMSNGIKMAIAKSLDIDSYYLSTDTCQNGFKIYDKNNRLISNDCFENYTKIEDEEALLLDINEEQYVLYNNKIIELNDGYLIGSYINKYSEKYPENSIYNLNGEKENTVCTLHLLKTYGEFYECKDSNHKMFLVNKKLNKVSNEYEGLECFDSEYCITTNNGLNGLLYKGKEIIKPIYNKIIIEDNKIVVNNLFGVVIYTISDEKGEKPLDTSELIIDKSYLYKNININEVIEEYNLESIKKIINDNEDFFKRYAYIVINNESLNPYKKQVFQLFPMLIDNKSSLKEEHFLGELRVLNIYKVDFISGGVAGIYDSTKQEIRIADDYRYVIYHELTHFVDFQINEDANVLYLYNDKYILRSEYEKLNDTEKAKCTILGDYVTSSLDSFIVEAGAEFFSSTYLRDNYVITYDSEVKIMNLLCYIFGYDTMKDIYFGEDSNAKLYALLYNNGATNEEIKAMGEYLNPYTTSVSNKSISITETLDVLLRIYEAKNNKSWLEDEKLTLLISTILGYYNLPDDGKRVDEYLKLNLKFYSFYEEKLGVKIQDLVYIPGSCVVTNDGFYIVLTFRDNNNNTYGQIVKYDFAKDEVIERKKVTM